MNMKGHLMTGEVDATEDDRCWRIMDVHHDLRGLDEVLLLKFYTVAELRKLTSNGGPSRL